MDIKPIYSALMRNKTGLALIVLQVAITLAVVCNSLFIVLERMERMDRPSGIDDANTFFIASLGFAQGYDRGNAMRSDLDRIRALPGVVAATATNTVPVSNGGWSTGFDTEPLDAVLARWRQAAGWPEDLAARVEAEFRRCLEAPAIRGVFTRPQGRWPELWRERAFDLIAGDVWVSGVFDRVVIERDAAGTCRRATLYDFKTDRVGPRPSDLKAAVRRYRDQIAGYRAALEKLCALGPSDVAARLVFLVPGRVEEA